ncbi:MAG: chemotaxis protein CheW [Planctomycetota bacterium]
MDFRLNPTTADSDTNPGGMSVDRLQDLLAFIEFELGDQAYAVPIKRVDQIVEPGSVTPLPGVNSYISGISNLRGEIIPVVDLLGLLEMGPTEDASEPRWLVVRCRERKMAWLVDRVASVLRVPETCLVDAPTSIRHQNPHVERMVKMDDRTVVLMDMDYVIDQCLQIETQSSNNEHSSNA